ncbi:MAG: hypothetical protein HN916_04415 [Anaerolineae bacterium]|nr:hypothetical protein [Anaerolineae bacterium]
MDEKLRNARDLNLRAFEQHLFGRKPFSAHAEHLLGCGNQAIRPAYDFIKKVACNEQVNYPEHATLHHPSKSK